MLTLLAGSLLLAADDIRPGFDDTPFLPGGQWRVHDKNRPYPPKKEPKKWDGKPVKAPKGAIFPTWTNAAWNQPDGTMRVAKGANIAKELFGSGKFHIEWRTPIDQNKDQGSGNSGVFFFKKYEIQILNCYNNVTYADGQTGAVYGQTPPMFNVCRPQGEWQTYDIDFVAPVFEGSKLKRPASVTVIHNGVKIQNKTKFIGATAYREVAVYEPHPPKGPLMLQDHGNPVEFRNIWVVPAK